MLFRKVYIIFLLLLSFSVLPSESKRNSQIKGTKVKPHKLVLLSTLVLEELSDYRTLILFGDVVRKWVIRKQFQVNTRITWSLQDSLTSLRSLREGRGFPNTSPGDDPTCQGTSSGVVHQIESPEPSLFPSTRQSLLNPNTQNVLDSTTHQMSIYFNMHFPFYTATPKDRRRPLSVFRSINLLSYFCSLPLSTKN